MYCHPQAMQKVFTQHYYSSTAHSRNRRATANGNSIKCSVPGLKNQVEIPFPDRKLPVCKRCKKIYKTRELCRVRDRHTEVPWSTTYICGTLDDSCFNRGSDGEMTLVEEGPMRFIAQCITGPPASYRSKDNALGGTKSPICMACKDKNYTRHHCRVKNKHLELPWGTVYVTISAVPSAPGAPGFFNDAESQSDNASIKSKRSFNSSRSDVTDEPSSKRSRSNDEADDESNSDEQSNEIPKKNGSTIQDIQSSKAFLLTVGKDECILSWLDVDTTVENHANEQGSWSQAPMDNMYHQPPFYHNGPPQGWSGYNNGFFPGNGNNQHPNTMMSSSNGMNNMPNQGSTPPMNGAPPSNGMPTNNIMHNSGRNTPNDFNPNNGYPSGPTYGDPSYQSQMKPNMQPGPHGQQMPFHQQVQQNYSNEDRENQGALSMNQGPGAMNNMNYPNKSFQQQGQSMNMNDGHSVMRNQGQGGMNRSPEQEYMPPSKPDYMNNTNNNIGGSLPQPPQPFVPRDQGYNGNSSQHNYNRGPPRDNFNVPPHMNAPNGYGGGNMPFYSSNQP